MTLASRATPAVLPAAAHHIDPERRLRLDVVLHLG